ncbi:AMP-dependent synthetase/ligase [Asanoa sp. NPDC050611]|uniref:AMP-dependent synthetase/ligase n=1 Tax=Asanoa sp. NPDC050611 TaxID=3157098 RepID=UPI0033E974D3
MLHRNAEQHGDRPAISVVGDPGPALTWRQVRERVAALARGLADLGVQAGDRVLIMMSSRPEHWLVDLALVHLGALPSTVYATLSADQLAYLAAHSRARLVVLEGAEQLRRWRPVLAQSSTVERVVVLDANAAPPDDPAFVAYDSVLATGAVAHAADPSAFDATWRQVTSQDPVTVLYTSGTTGDPKAVALSHLNVIYQAACLEATVPTPDHADSVAYLPLAHIAERMLGIYNVVYRAGHVHICADPTNLLPALQEVRPASFFGVPRIWEKMATGLQVRVGGLPTEQRAGVQRATDVALTVHKHRETGSPVPADLAGEFAALDDAVLRPIRAILGLDATIWPGSGAAPIPVEVLRTLAGFGVGVLEVWGMTETTGTATINTPDRFRTGTVGRPNLGMEVRVAADGEILVRGPLVCLGYLEDTGAIAPATDPDGWLATGDVGVLDSDGFLTITDRKKELIINSSGKNISPAHVESLIRSNPLVGYVAAIGDRRPYVTALVVLDEEMAPIWARGQGLGVLGYRDLATHPAVVAAIEAVITAANDKLSRPEWVRRFRILTEPWTAESGELTPKLSMRRAVIAARYADVIDAMYADEPSP